MTVQKLIDRLQDFDPEAEVRLLTQQHWPFENSILGLCDSRDLNDGPNDCGCGKDDCPECNPDEEQKVVFIVEGEQLGYGNKKAWEVAG
jgi:hypothetical protein